MSQYKPYAAYKDSGVEWLGRVPEHWGVRPLGYEMELLTGYAFSSEKFDFESGIALVRGDNVTEGALRWGGKARYWPNVASELEKFLLKERDVVVGMDGSKVGKNYAMITSADLPLLLVQRVARLRAGANIGSDYIFWFIGSPLFRSWVDLVRTDPAIPHISPKDINGFPISLPPLVEQDAIVNHLSAEVARIEALIEKKSFFIELLREKRQALITHAVTKGLDPSAKMKESGVEWLGAVPEHWVVSPLKHLARFRSGGTPSKEKLEYWGGDVPWASAKDLKREVLVDTIDHLTLLAVESGVTSLVPANSILVVVRGMILARLFPVVETLVPMAINQDLKALVPSERLNSRYLAHLLRGSSAESLSRLEEAGHGTKALRMENWISIELPVPPLHEQLSIVKFLDGQSERIDALVEMTERSIALLKERRAALITAAVTGQIDLREAA